MAKKRPTLDAFLNSQSQTGAEGESAQVSARPVALKAKKVSSVVKMVKEKVSREPVISKSSGTKHEVVRHMLYLPLPVYDQLQDLIFEEQRGQTRRRKTHDYLLDAIDLLFKEKGLKSIAKLTAKENS